MNQGEKNQSKEGEKQASKEEGEKTNLKEVLETLEALCCFDAWTRLDKYWKLEEEDEFAKNAQNAICRLLHMIKTCLPHED